MQAKHRKFGLKEDGTLGWLYAPTLRSRRENLPPKPELRKRPYALELDCGESVSKIDWLRVSFRGIESLHILEELTYELQNWLPDVHLMATSKKMLGYSQCITLGYWRDNSLINIGFIGVEDDLTSSNCGMVFDLAGVGCGLIQSAGYWRDMVDFIHDFDCSRITRADIALDLSDDYCRQNHITVPVIGAWVEAGLYDSSKKPASVETSVKTAGDWSDIIYGRCSVNTYVPSYEGKGGLTHYYGKRTSPVFFRTYEKAKQLLGTLKEVDKSLEDQQWWVRIEAEFKRDRNGGEIPFELLLQPDLWLVYNRPKLKLFLDRYLKYLGNQSFIADVKKTFRKKEQELKLEKKIFWARRQYGRLVKTLLDLNLTDSQIISRIKSTKTLKDFINDLDFDVSS